MANFGCDREHVGGGISLLDAVAEYLASIKQARFLLLSCPTGTANDAESSSS